MEQDKWDAILEHPQIVFARTSPQQKLVIVENNQARVMWPLLCGTALLLYIFFCDRDVPLTGF